MANTSYFKDILKKNEEHLTKLHGAWGNILIDPDTSEHVKRTIRFVLGQTNILITKRFSVMEKFLTIAEQKDLDVNNEDLQGLWDIINIEVISINKKYKALEMIVSKKQTRAKQDEETPATSTQKRPSRKDSLYGRYLLTGETPSTSSSAEMYSTSTPSKIRNKPKKPFSALFKAPIKIFSETDDSEDEFFDILVS